MNIRVTLQTTQAAEGMPRRRFTVSDVEAMVAAGIMDEDERVEPIGGELVPMPAKGNRHEMVKGALIDRSVRARPDEVRLIPETTFRSLEAASDVVVPLVAPDAFALRLDELEIEG